MFKFRLTRTFVRSANSVTGVARIVDGDTIVVAGERLRLHGIDAPETDQMFLLDGKWLPSGIIATAVLETLTAGVTLRGDVIEQDRYGRPVVKCYSPNGVDIGGRLVSAGWALAYRRYSLDYVTAEQDARMARRGLWKGRFMKPWAWRQMNARRQEAETAAALNKAALVLGR